MEEENKQIIFSELQRMSFTNSPKLPHKVFFVDKDGDKHFKMWVGIGWIPIAPCDDAIEVIDG